MWIALIVLLVGLGMGSSSSSTPTLEPTSPPGTGRRVQALEGENGVWTFAVLSGGNVVHTETPFESEEAARIAGEAWLAANPI